MPSRSRGSSALVRFDSALSAGGDLAGLIVTLLPLIVVGAMTPTHVLAVIVLLETPTPLKSAGSFVLGLTFVRVALGFFALLFIHNASWSSHTQDSTGSILTLLIGLLLLGTAGVLIIRKPNQKATKPPWQSMLEAATPVKAFFAGIGLMVISPRHWAILISGALAIGAADISIPSEVLMLALYIALLEIFVWAPVALYVWAPERASSILARAKSWYAKNGRRAMIAVSGIIGLVLVTSAIVSLFD
jgi:Sap, sulfolipid-1-addressing protein